MSADAQWARLLDREHVTAGLIDIGVFLTAMAVVEDNLVGTLQPFLAEAGRLGDQLDDLDRRIVDTDTDVPASALADVAAWFVRAGGLSDIDRTRLCELAAQRDALARRTHRALIETDAGSLLTDVIDLRDILHRASRWWFVNVETGGAMAPDAEVTSLAEAVLAHIIEVAQRAARS